MSNLRRWTFVLYLDIRAYRGIKPEPGLRAEGWEGRKPKEQGADSQAITLR